MEYLTDEQIIDKYKQLPEDLKRAIFSVGMTEIIKNIGKKYQLHIDKIGELGNETGMVMLGVTHPRDYISNLAQRLGVDKETARKIAEEVNTQIFAKVRESLKKVHSIPDKTIPSVKDMEKEAIVKEIEKEESPSLAEKIPEILKGATEAEAPGIDKTEPPHPFEAKTKEEIFRIPPEEKRYPSGDPYRESIE